MMYEKKDVGYGPADGDKRCSECKFFRIPDECQLVKDEISEDGVCDLWESALDQLSQDMFGGPIGSAQDPSGGFGPAPTI